MRTQINKIEIQRTTWDTTVSITALGALAMTQLFPDHLVVTGLPKPEYHFEGYTLIDDALPSGEPSATWTRTFHPFNENSFCMQTEVSVEQKGAI